MKYFYLNLLLSAVLVFTFAQMDYSNAFFVKPEPTPTPAPTVTPTPTATPTPTQAPPVRLVMPKLGVDTAIQPVGVNERGEMEAPADWHAAGYYLGGSKPGETGTAFIDGHYDDQFGQPAIFFSLNQLVAGDEIIVYDALANELTFTVTETTSVARDSSTADLIRNEDGKNIVLITCAGWWDYAAGSYTDRLVVFATKVERLHVD